MLQIDRTQDQQMSDLDRASEDQPMADLVSALDSSPKVLVEKAWFYCDQFQQLAKPSDLEKAIECGTRALALTPDNHPDFPTRLADLAVFYNDRFEYLDELEDLDKAIAFESRALSLTPSDHPNIVNRVRNIGALYSDRFEHLGELQDLDNTVEYESRLLALTPDGHPHLPQRLNNLGVSYANRFEYLGDLNDLEKSIEYSSRALALTPEDHPNFPTWLGNLGASYSDRFRHLDQLNDLEKAIEYESRAVTLTPDDDPDFSRRLSNLGSSYRDRFRRLGNLDDLEKAIEYKTRILSLVSDDHPDLPAQLDGLAMCYSDRFEHLGVLENLDKAIEFSSRAIDLAPNDHPDLPSWLGNLGASYSDRLGHLGELNDLERAIECKARAVELTPEGHPNLPDQLGNLAVSYSDRYQRLRELADLEKAIEYDSHALALTPKGHPSLPSRFSNLGASYSDRFKNLGQLDDLEKSIEFGIRAIELTPHGHTNLPPQLLSLGTSYNDRFKHLGQLDDLEMSIKHKSRALLLTPEGHPDVPLGHFGLADSYFAFFQHTANLSYLQYSLESFRKASQSSTGAPRNKFHYALHWAKLAFEHSPLNPIEAFQTIIVLLPQYTWLGATTDQRYHDLSSTRNLAVDAAMTAILSSDYSTALEWLEHARCVVWNQSLMLRSPLDELQSSHPTLANRLKTVAMELLEGSSESHASRVRLSSSLAHRAEQAAQNHRRLADEYNDLLSQVRKLSEFEDFLQPMKVKSLIKAARNGPIVTINCSRSRCDALIVLPGQDKVHWIPLPNFTYEDAQCARSGIQMSLKSQGIRERGAHLDDETESEPESCFGEVLKHLWSGIVKPVLDFLKYTVNKPTDNLPHITWCPTGVVSFLPLHAAGDYDQPDSRVFDYVISSYTPTLTALLSTSPSSLRSGSRILGIGQETTSAQGYRLSNLPGTTRELSSLRQHTRNTTKVGFSELIGNKATKAAVLKAMEQHDWVHLACHAHQNVENATESGFFLHDGILDIASINRRSLKNKGLAFLSACQTATGDKKLPDEAVHLASGMLMAGYSSVIATMWSVSDEDALFVADRVYGQLMKDGEIGNGEAGKALHRAITALRDKIGVKEFGQWVPYIHIGS
ncbi:Girdin [Rhizoctonia solani]|uniref:Girdin n=1 Tax=Rhizoctonia solani TaxID=456999 RepID=A0A0K6FLV7_9AGAM|nr:Girdin [Rhizoctonia solani]